MTQLHEPLIEAEFEPLIDDASNPWKEKGPKSYQTTSNATSSVAASTASRTVAGVSFSSTAVSESNKSDKV